MTSEADNEPSKSCEIDQSVELEDVVDRFRAYRQKMEANAMKLKEANTVIDRLKTEISISRDVEATLRSQIVSAENRIIYIQKTNTKILTVADRVRKSEKESQQINQKVNQIKEVIEKLKDESQNVLKITSNESDLMKKYEEINFKLKNKENELSLLKIENQALSKQKQDIEIQAEHDHKILQNNLEEIKRELKEMQARNDQILTLYKKQIEDHELTIKEYERERKSLLEDFAMPKPSEESSDTAWPDNMSIPEDRSLKNFKPVKSSEYDEEDNFFSNAPCSQGKVVNKRVKHVGFKTKRSNKEKPQLEFLSSQTNSFDAPPKKRRLFSTNCNHYNN